MQDITPKVWSDEEPDLTADNFNTEIRDTYGLLINPPTCVVHRSSALSIPNGSGWTVVGWDSAAVCDTEDPATPMYSSAQNTRVTCQTPGWYNVVGALGLSAGAGSTVEMTAIIRVNGTAYFAGDSSKATPFNDLYVSPSDLISLSLGDYVEMLVTHVYASPLDLIVADHIPSLSLFRCRGI